MVGAFFITAFINVLNDLHDVPEDRLNHPQRPLPSGRVGEEYAWILAIFTLFFALYFSFQHSPWALAVGSLAMFLALLYNVALKGVPLLGNLTVALTVSLAFLYGSGGYMLHRVLPAALLGFYLHLLREFVKTLQDARGDAPYRRTLAHVWGEKRLRWITAIGLVLLLPLIQLPLAFGYSQLYAASVTLLVGFPTLLSLPLLFKGKYGTLSTLLKLETALALISLWLA